MRLRAAFLIVGMVLILGSGSVLLSAHLARNTSPGKLVAVNPSITRDRPAENGANQPVEFELRNEGGKTVRIEGVESSCGCAKPSVNPTVIPPGGKSILQVMALWPAAGEQTVHATVHTDSPLTPKVELGLRMIAQPPPYLNQVGGDLTFLDDASPDQARSFYAVTVERPGDPSPPEPSCDLPFVKITFYSASETPNGNGETVMRTYQYQVTINPVPNETFVGTIRVPDPWKPNNVRTVGIQGRPRPVLKAMPSPLNLGRQTPGKLIVTSRYPSDHLSVTPEGAANDFFTIERATSEEIDNGAVFVLSPRADRSIPNGTYQLTVEVAEQPSERLIVPVVVKDEAGQ